MASKCHNIFKYLFPASIAAIMTIIIIETLRRVYIEGLKNYGDPDISSNAPIPYKKIVDEIKFPDRNEPIYDIGDASHNHLLFNREDKKQLYSDYSISQDMKYFNNATNLILEHHFNYPNLDDISELVTNESEISSVTGITGISAYQGVYDQLTQYSNSDLSNVMNPAGKYSSYYFESNYADISDNVRKDFKYFNNTATIRSGGSTLL